MFLRRGAPSALRRHLASKASHHRRAASTGAALQNKNSEGTIEEIFSSFHESPPFPERFAHLKQQLWTDGLVESWREVLKELEDATGNVIARGSQSVPEIPYSSLNAGLSANEIEAMKSSGCAIIRGAVPEAEARDWIRATREYITANKANIKGSPAENIVFYELYGSPAQIQARSHPHVIKTHESLLASLFHASPTTPVSLHTPISYFDRLRIRPPGPSQFTLGPHMDGGSIERWEDEQYRRAYSTIFQGGSGWRGYDAWDLTERVGANQDLYNAPNQCSILRPLQGWLSLSHTAPGEGTLQVLPLLKEATAYIMLRPFFRPTARAERGRPLLDFGSWEPALDVPAFPGSVPAKAQVLSDATHPHLRLDAGGVLVSVPAVRPGDQVFWHCDLVHAVEAAHTGAHDSAVLYVPAVPFTVGNAGYLRSQLLNFAQGLPAPDFPGGPGEAGFVGQNTPADVKGAEAMKVFGLEAYTEEDVMARKGRITEGEREALYQGNMILF
ncbi:uncharacterized protein PHACADRAFT_176135 [Phanerochaete carnosa HHB-10118-sp]|uniref:DUF1479-domain-containing protein n=1 Tax=Phanerochaete carnosa (strain HHB-10118-sp) TaxID=650164 RepID=K5W3N2_PHACS|nr:uncharacterized protein PHACADRAFT_176135 [Phanerochaete carnosa HHB-10118-sp]EKM53735.1 hypothetical protein PHACADRAFT_176135 [Phanerochaete carnosa HHB-10118-sp]